ncbi:hypothetical protein ACFYNX_27195 [Streptomyces sp. NPDC007872]|uniref:hypothetical protein n=1 Tax=Streptomyces sp. NPDC007872 TaxID=3364782 RepID=UPI00369F9591
MLRATQADTFRRRAAQALVTVMLAISAVVAGPAAPQARADVTVPDWANPCNAPGGKYLCDKAKEGAEWLYENSGAKSLANGVGSVADFTSDPFGYIEGKLRGGTKGMFEAFGEELTGKKPSVPADGGEKPKKADKVKGN